MTKLKKDFFVNNTLQIAQDLLGKFLVRKSGDKRIVTLISETEAYHGPSDLASHASRGRTPRTEVMFGPAGRAYIYLIYGRYYCFNIVTGKRDFPAAVLIRGIKIIKNNKIIKEIYGPGKVCMELAIDKKLNKKNLLNSNNLFVTEDKKLLAKLYPKGFKVIKDKRVGVDYAGKYKDKLWRFLLSQK